MTIPHPLTPQILKSMPQGSLITDFLDQAILDAVVENIRNLCGWHVFPIVTETVRIPYRGDTTILAPSLRVERVLEAKVRDHVLDVDRVDVYPHGELVLGYRPAGAPWSTPRPLDITMEHGFPLESVSALVGVIIQMISRAGETTPTGDGSLSVGGVSYSMSSGITPKSSEWLVIDRFRLRDA